MDLTPQPQPVPISDVAAMRQALRCARRAAEGGEVPVGAVVAHAGRIIGTGYNTPITGHDPSAHAEINALREAARQLGNYRLDACTLYVTLEPCIMCAGAILNARIGRVVFAAHDPKAGAAGSVIDLFADTRLNHQTRIEGGLLAEQGRAILQQFFQARRLRNDQPLREDALRTPDAAFSNLPDYPWPPTYISHLPALDGLRLHYVDAGPPDASRTWLLLHGSPVWSYAFRHLIRALASNGQRVIAPDLPGFGKSDKPKRARAHQLAWYVQILEELVEHLDLQHVVLVGQGLGNPLAARLLTVAPLRYASVIFLDQVLSAGRRPNPLALRTTVATPPSVESQAWAAPFPNAGFKAAIRSDAALTDAVPADILMAWPRQWTGQTLIIRPNASGDPTVDVLAGHARGVEKINTKNVLPDWLSSIDTTSAIVARILTLLAES